MAVCNFREDSNYSLVKYEIEKYFFKTTILVAQKKAF